MKLRLAHGLLLAIALGLSPAFAGSLTTGHVPTADGAHSVTDSGYGIGTSGSNLCPLNSACAWSQVQTYTLAPVFSDAPGTRSALGLGTASTQNTGTSGANVPLANGTNTWANPQTFTQAPTFTDQSGSRTALGLGGISTYGLGVGLQSNGSNVDALGLDQKHIAGAATVTLANTDCGGNVSGYGSGDEKITLPAAPPAGCKFTAQMPGNGNLLIDSQGVNLQVPGWGNHSLDVFQIPATNNKRAVISLSYEGSWWQATYYTMAWYEAAAPLSSPVLAHGQTYFNFDGSAYFQFCPKRGPGGIVIDGQMHRVGSYCWKLPQASTTSSTTNYFYALNVGSADVSTIGNNGSGKVRATFTSSLGLSAPPNGSQVGISCHSIRGTTEANVQTRGTVVSNTIIDMPDISYVNTFTTSANAACRVEYILASTTTHATSNPWINIPALETKSGTDTWTYIGSGDIGVANAVNSTQSWMHCEYDFTGAMKSNADGTCQKAAASDLSDTITGTGNLVKATSPTLVTPALGTPSAVVLTNATNVPAAQLSGVVPAANGGAGTITGALKGNGSGVVSQAAASDLSDTITGSGNLVKATSPTLTTPTIGVATATSINKTAITAPATSSTLAIADGKTLTASNTLTFAGTDSTTETFQGTGTVVNRDSTDTLTNKSIAGSEINSGTVPAAQGGAGTINGALKGNGSGVVSQAACADLSNGTASCSTDATNASNIASGTLAAARGGAGTISGALKGNGSGVVSQAACSDLSNGATGCSTATGTSGATIPLLNGANTYSAAQVYQKANTDPAGNTGSGTFLPMGVVYSITASAATTTGTGEQTLGTYSLPANSLDTAGRNLRINACFKHAANTNTVTSRLYFGAAVISDAGMTATGSVQCLWMVVLKTGSNTQNVVAGGQKGTVVTMLAAAYTAATETDTAGITIKATGQDGTSSAADDTLVSFTVEYMN